MMTMLGGWAARAAAPASSNRSPSQRDVFILMRSSYSGTPEHDGSCGVIDSEAATLLAQLTPQNPDQALRAFERLKKEGSSGLSPRVKNILDAAMARKDWFVRDLACELLLEFDGAAALSAVFEAMLPDLGDD